jgi:hypothetical protein
VSTEVEVREYDAKIGSMGVDRVLAEVVVLRKPADKG